MGEVCTPGSPNAVWLLCPLTLNQEADIQQKGLMTWHALPRSQMPKLRREVYHIFKAPVPPVRKN